MTNEEIIEFCEMKSELEPENKDMYDSIITKVKDRDIVLDKLKGKIDECLEALKFIENSPIKIYSSDEILGRRLTYKQCLEFVNEMKEAN